MNSIPQWARRLGYFGIALFALWLLLGRIFDAVLESETQNQWDTKIKPILTASHEISFEIANWVILLVILILLGVLAVLAYWLKRPKRTRPREISPKHLPLPKEGDKPHNNIRVMRAKREVEQQRLPPADFAVIVEQSVNMGDISKETGAQLLEPYRYVLILNPNATVSAERKRRRK